MSSGRAHEQRAVVRVGRDDLHVERRVRDVGPLHGRRARVGRRDVQLRLSPHRDHGRARVNPSSNFQDFLQRQGAIATRFHDADPSTPVGPELLGTYDIVIVDQLLRGYSADESTALRTWVEAGGGLVVLTGHTRSVGHVHNTLLQSFSVSYNANNLISGPATLLRHPLTLAESGDVLPPVTFLGGYHVGEGPGAPAGLVPFATVADMPVGLAGPVGMGRVVFWGDEWIEFDSEWGTMPAITRLWFNIVRWTKPDPDIAPRCGD
jgi:hypothetical protein